MITKIPYFQTADGYLFKTAEEAHAHIKGIVQVEFDAFLTTQLGLCCPQQFSEATINLLASQFVKYSDELLQILSTCYPDLKKLLVPGSELLSMEMVYRYETEDGVEFNTLEEAEEHERLLGIKNMLLQGNVVQGIQDIALPSMTHGNAISTQAACAVVDYLAEWLAGNYQEVIKTLGLDKK